MAEHAGQNFKNMLTAEVFLIPAFFRERFAAGQ